MVDVTMPNGDVVNFPDDMPKEQIRNLIATKFPQETASPTVLRDTPYPSEQITSFASGMMDTVSLGGMDEASAAAASMAGGNYDYELQKRRNLARQQAEQTPYAYTGGQITGAMLPIAGAGSKKVAEFAAKGPIQTIAASSGIGALSGGLYGLGSGEGQEGRMEEAQRLGTYGAFGGPVGVGAAKLARGVGRVASPLTDRAKKLFGDVTGTTPQKLAPTTDELIEGQAKIAAPQEAPKAYTSVEKSLKRDFGEDYDNLLRAYKGGDMSLADFYGKRTQSLAEAAALFPAGREIAEEAIEKKAGGAYDRLLSSVRKNISGVDAYYTTAEDLANAGRSKAAPLYEKAYQDVLTDTQPLQMPEVQDALARAYKQYPTKLKGVEPNSIEALDYAKKVLDDDIGKAFRAGEKNLAGSRVDVKNRLVSAMDEASPSYAQARKEAADYLTIQSAMDNGKAALKADPEIVSQTVKNLTPQERDAYRIGFGKAIRDELNKVREGANPFNRLLKSPEQQARAKAILGPQEYLNWEKSLRAEDKLFKFRNKVLGGSPTARREEAKELISSGMIDSISGVPRQTFANAIQKFKSGYLQGINDKTAAKISDIIYETDPVKKLQIIDKLKGAKDFTPKEIQTIERAYSLMSPRYDALYTQAPIAGGLATSATQEE
jgi:hypothetical protein